MRETVVVLTDDIDKTTKTNVETITFARGIHLTGLAQLRGFPWEGPIWAS
jgi:hypothetical protein